MRLVLVHGFTQTGRSWGPIAERLISRGNEVMCPDLPGHGAKRDIRADLAEAAALLAHEAGPAIWVGYSLGGRVCLHLDPAVVGGLVLVSTTAGIEDPAERASRRRADDLQADEIERVGTAAFVERWLEGPLWTTLGREVAGVEHRLENSPAGLASSLRLCGTGVQASMWEHLHAIDVPVLVVTGDEDRKFTAVGDRIAAAIGPNASRTRLPGAGHAVPWEQPDTFVAHVDRWLTRHWR